MTDPNGQLDAIIVAIQALDTKIENYSINLRQEFVGLREIFASHREYVDRRFKAQDDKLAHIVEVVESFQRRPIGFTPDGNGARRYTPEAEE